MQTLREPRPSDIFDEIARGTKLEQTLQLIALKATLDLKAPTCKIWVVKHGDICERCPLADVCTNRQMCLHLVTTVGAEMENEYPRIPLSVLNMALIARGGVAEFKEPDVTGEKLFGIQQKDFLVRPCSYALYPLKGISGTVGVIGVFNDRLIEPEEVQILAQLAPAAVAAIRVAELQARCDSLRYQLERESAGVSSQDILEQTQAHEIAAQRAASEVSEWQKESKRLEERIAFLEATNTELRDNNAALSEHLDDARSALRLAEDTRTRAEQERLKVQEKLDDTTKEMEHLVTFHNQKRGETDHLISENERLHAELANALANAGNSEKLSELQAKWQEIARRLNDVEQENTQLKAEKRSLEHQTSQLEEVAITFKQHHANLEDESASLKQQAAALQQETESLHQQKVELEGERNALRDVNTQMEEAMRHLEEIMPRLEETTNNLRERVEISERLCTELEQRNRELLEENQQLAEQRQGQADLLANISHEIRTLLHSIVGFTSLLLDDPSLPLKERQRHNLERVAGTSRELADFVNKILDYSKMEAGRMGVYAEDIEVRELLSRVVHIAEGLKSDQKTTLVTEIASDLPTIRTDRTKLQQILLNLLSNALKFTREGKIEVVASRPNDSQISFVVRDTGIGIDETELGKIFDDFYQVNRLSAKAGSGLGLAITRRLVHLLGGEIAVNSRPGEGSVFTVTLPLAIESREAASAEMPLIDPECTALVISADAATLYLTRKYLTGAGYSVATTSNLAHGLELLRLAHPSLIVVDLDAMDNHADTVNQLASQKGESRLIVLSANPNLQLRAINSGADRFLHKPIERNSLLAMLYDAPAPESFVLVVDDDADAREIMTTILETSGYRVKAATNGREAMETITHARPQLLILDLMMPEMDGFEVEHRLRVNPNWHDIPVLLMTARDLTNEERAALKDGTARVMQKGNFSREDLLNEVANAIKKD